MSTDFDNVRLVEALLFASAEPLAPAQLARFLPEDTDLDAILSDLETLYANRGVNLVKRGGRWAFRTAVDLAPRMELETKVVRKLSRVALETLAVIAYHQPVTRGEIEEIRGVALSKGTLDTLLEIGWIRPKGRRKTPGRPVTWGTSEAFLDHFGLDSLDALPGAEELKAAGLLDSRPAITALGDRGLLPGVGEVAPEAVDEDGEEAEDENGEGGLAEGDEGVLDPEFGENLLPQEVDLAALSAEDQDGAGAPDAEDEPAEDEPAEDEPAEDEPAPEQTATEPEDQEAREPEEHGPDEDDSEDDSKDDEPADEERGELVDLNAEGAKRGHG